MATHEPATASVVRTELISRALIALVAILGLVIVTSTTYTVFLIRETQQSGSPAVKAIESCTVPTGECYKLNQRNTASAIQSVNEITVYANVCGQRLGQQATVEAVKKCVDQLYDQAHPGEKP